MDEIEALTKRFKDYIDKVQAAFDKSPDQMPDVHVSDLQNAQTPKKLYTIVSPVEAMASNLRSVLKAIDNAIDNMDELVKNEDGSGPEAVHPENGKTTPGASSVISAEPLKEKFTEEELDFLVRTFNSMINSSEEEREKLFNKLEKKDTP